MTQTLWSAWVGLIVIGKRSICLIESYKPLRASIVGVLSPYQRCLPKVRCEGHYSTKKPFIRAFQSCLLGVGAVKTYGRAVRKAISQSDFADLDAFKATYSEDAIKCIKSVINGKSAKKRRIEERFYAVAVSGNALFITLTFNNKALATTTEETRRRLAARFLKSQCCNYVANIDFGDKSKNPDSNEREHYHALAMPLDGDSIQFDDWYKYGAIKVERVRTSAKDCIKVSKYVAKLGYHALKDSTKLPRLIWSRGFEAWFHDEKTQERLLPF